ncbi:MAG: hypothetical protein MUF18_13560, partial [Fimbriiglobus sp.]|nr:hypothetical protein [Fimbriiglobus sp.]
MATILVAERSAEQRAEIADAVAAVGHTAEFLDGVDEVFEAVRRSSPELLIADAELGGPGAIELTRRMRQEYPTVPVLLLIDVVNKEAVA